MSWFWTLLLLLAFAYSCNSSSEAHKKHHKKSPSAVVVGTVYCDTCFQQDITKSSHFIPGATVAVECKDNSKPSFKQQVQTDIHGKFQVHLPFHVSKHLRKIEGCSVKLISSNKPFCSIAATAASSNLNLKSRKQGTHIFSAGFFTFKPAVCDQKPIINNNKLPPFPNPNDPTAFPPPIQDPPPSDPPALGNLLPPLPQLPLLPPLPRLPPLPGLPFIPPKHKPSGLPDNNNLVDQPDQFFPFPPNPFNPPSLFPPNPFQPPPSLIPPVFPTPPPSIFPPLIPSPPSPPIFGLPPIPGLTPSSPPPPPPLFPVIPLPPPIIPLPPFPFEPSPGFPGPGVPPAEVALPAKTNSP